MHPKLSFKIPVTTLMVTFCNQVNVLLKKYVGGLKAGFVFNRNQLVKVKWLLIVGGTFYQKIMLWIMYLKKLRKLFLLSIGTFEGEKIFC